MSSSFILAIDQGTTSSRAIVFNEAGQVVSQHQLPITQSYPHNGWVEHDPEEILQTVIQCCQQAVQKSQVDWQSIKAIGISNQRETTVCWERKTGQAIYPAIVWQDRRTADDCLSFQQDAHFIKQLQSKTGLRMDPYFSATKLKWILEHVDGAKEQASQGALAFGTIDSFLIWHLTGGRVHATDATNAARTLLFNIHTQSWDEALLKAFSIPASILPSVLDSNARFGVTSKAVLGAELPITGVAGDQQAAFFGQACFERGMVKSTYGTGCFLMMNTGDDVVQSRHQLISTIGYRVNGKVTYALEGSIFVAGSAVQWLRDALNLIDSADQSAILAESVSDTNGVYLVPAFTGLGAPYWDPTARGAILGLTRDTGIAHIVRAALEAVCYQTADLLAAIQDDTDIDCQSLRVDGGMVVNDWLMQFLADVCGVQVERPVCIETSARGAAMLAGLGCDLYESIEQIAQCWQLGRVYLPQLPADKRGDLLVGWQRAVERIVNTV